MDNLFNKILLMWCQQFHIFLSMSRPGDCTLRFPFQYMGSIITFTMHFKYLGGYILYSLRDDYDVNERISQASSAMGVLNHFWSDRTVDDYSKYLIVWAIPINLLLWGSESWALRETTLSKLEVFLHRSVRKILRIDITQVMDERITNGSIRNRFFSIPKIRKQIAQLLSR